MVAGSTIDMITLSMRAAVVSLEPGRLSPIRCLNRRSTLALCQPDINIPDQLMGSCKVGSTHGCCKECRCLHMIGLTGESKAVVMLLPSSLVIQEAILRKGGIPT